MTKRSSDPRLQPLRLTVVGLVLIILAALAFLLLRPSAEPPSTQEVLQPNSPEAILRVNLPDAKLAYESRSAVFVDVRDESSFKNEHIPGALSIPLNDLPAREGELDPNAWIITYCT
jgi:3-mercaptopyruvate sulfurtransferase SseA